MKHSRLHWGGRVLGRLWLVALTAMCAVGCSPEAQFKGNLIYTFRQERENGAKLGDRAADVADVLTALIGTPDEPHVPNLGVVNWEDVEGGFSGPELESLANFEPTAFLDPGHIQMAAGPVGSDEHGRPRGLYREHCAHCHGINGDGRGPTAAFLNPYPRDYRMGKYKFKSTPIGKPPTHQDLHAIIVNGIPGTAMPSFQLLPADEIEALVQYVKYLSVRGEVERGLINMALEGEETSRLLDVLPPEASAEAKAAQALKVAAIKALVNRVMGRWWVADLSATPVAKRPAELQNPTPESIERGREVFFTIANCNKCHGDTALGDGESNLFDDWTNEIDPKNPKSVAEFMRLGALEPRIVKPRNLRQGIYRGGRRPVDIYWRVFNGIDGAGMPGVKDSVQKPGDPPDPKKMSEEDVWHLVNYVRQLPYEPVSRPTEIDPQYQRERN